MQVWIAGLMLLAACGRFGYDPVADAPRSGDATVDAAADAALDAAVDAPIDAPPVCPAGTTELAPESTACIELVERGNEPWAVAKTTCFGLGRRLCAGAEWFLACTSATGLVDMTEAEWEWVAEESGGIADKRGDIDCSAMSNHPAIDPYDYRCCADKI